jgi:transcription initiation factor TFIID TATA-box-binding protein
MADSGRTSAENTVDDPQATLEIGNVVASSALGQEIDLESVALDLSGGDFDPERFPGLIYRPDTAEATCLVFRSGQITCTGAGTIEGARETIHTAVDALQDLGIEVEKPHVAVQNVVLSGDLGETLHLEAVAIGLGLEDVEYEPEQFPGLIYRLEEANVAILLFGPGSVVITGAKTRGTYPTDRGLATADSRNYRCTAVRTLRDVPNGQRTSLRLYATSLLNAAKSRRFRVPPVVVDVDDQSSAGLIDSH